MITADEVRSFALSLPEVEEKEHWGKPSFRVRNKIFAVIQEDGKSLVVKTTEEDRIAYITMEPAIFSVPKSYSNLNYMLIQMNFIGHDELCGLLLKGWRMVAPKRLVNIFDNGGSYDGY